MDRETMNKLYSYLFSRDVEMRSLGITLLMEMLPDSKQVLEFFSGYARYPPDPIRAELCRLIQRECKDYNSLKVIQAAAQSIKNEAVRAQEYEKAAFFRDIERNMGVIETNTNYENRRNSQNSPDGGQQR